MLLIEESAGRTTGRLHVMQGKLRGCVCDLPNMLEPQQIKNEKNQKYFLEDGLYFW